MGWDSCSAVGVMLGSPSAARGKAVAAPGVRCGPSDGSPPFSLIGATPPGTPRLRRAAKMGRWTPMHASSPSRAPSTSGTWAAIRGRDGRPTRWGRLFRADALHELTSDDVDRLRDLGLRTVVDLRTERELARTGRGPLEPEDVAFHHLAVVQEGVPGRRHPRRSGRAASRWPPPPRPATTWPSATSGTSTSGRHSLVGALTLLGGDEHYPLVFHCAAGKDRTGVLAALVLEIVGVDRDVIVADYVITAERLRFIMDRWLGRTRVRRADGQGAGLAVQRGGIDHGGLPRPACRPDTAGPGPGRWRPACRPGRSTGWSTCCSSRILTGRSTRTSGRHRPGWTVPARCPLGPGPP